MMSIAAGFGWMREPWVEALGWTLVHSVWELAAIGIAAALAMMAMRRASAQMRYAVGAILFLAMGMDATGTFAYLMHRTSVHLAAGVSAGAPEAREAGGAVAVTVSPDFGRNALPEKRGMAMLLTEGLPYLAAGYLLIAGLLMLRLVVAYGALRRLCTSGSVLEGDAEGMLRRLQGRMGIGRTVRLVESAAVEVPTVLGVLRPLILVPASALTGLSAEHLEGLLAHELAHIRRHDYLANLVQSVIETVLFYHPAVWWLSCMVREEREHCCDDVATAVVGSKTTYARALVSMENLRAAPVGVPAALAMGAGSGNLLGRIERLLGVTTARKGGTRMINVSGAVVLIGIIALMINLLPARAQQHNASSSDEKILLLPTPAKATISAPEAQGGVDEEGAKVVARRLEDFAINGRLDDVMKLLRDRQHLDIVVNWKALEAAGVQRDARVAVNMHDVTVGEAISAAISQLDRGNVRVEFVASNGLITVSTHEDLQASELQVAGAFDFRNLLIWPVDTEMPPAIATGEEKRSDHERAAKDEAAKHRLVSVIEETVDPGSWKDRGGKVGDITVFSNNLLVHQTMKNMAAVEKLLGTMRAAHSLQISIESRLMFVDESLFKELAEKVPSLAKGAAGAQKDAPFDVLSQEQMNDVLTRIQKDSDSVSVAAPRVTLFNGQHALIEIAREQGFIAKGEGTPPQEKISKVNLGVFLGINAALSADREMVAVKVNLEMRSLQRMDEEQAVGPDGKSVTFQTPVLDIRKLETLMSVKSKGVAIFGGMLLPPPQLPAGVADHEQSGVRSEPKRLIVLIRPIAIIPPDADPPK